MDPNTPQAHVERPFELERIIFFSDAVFAIAITLLALELKLPDLKVQTSGALLTALANDGTRFFAFGLSFWIIAALWQGHHRYFRYIVRYDDGLIGRNMLILFFTVLIPFTTLVLGEYGTIPAGCWLYALDLGGVGLADAALWHYATAGQRLVESNLDPRFIRSLQIRAFVTVTVAGLVILLSFSFSAYANLAWTLLYPIQRLLRERYKAYPSAG